MSQFDARKKQLTKRLRELDGRLSRIADHLEQAPNPDWEEEAQEAEMDEVLEELGQVGATEVAGIKAALKRIADGSYGACTRCGDDISAERLDVLPHSPLCQNCAHEVSKENH